MELIPQLYEHIEKEVVVSVACKGTTGHNNERVDCSGDARILLKFREARRHGGHQSCIEEREHGIKTVLEKLLNPLPVRFMTAAAGVKKLIE